MNKFACLGLLIAGNLLTSCASLDSPLPAKSITQSQGYSAEVVVNRIAVPPREMGFASARNNAHDPMVFICDAPAVNVPNNAASTPATGPQNQGSNSEASGGGAFTMAQNLSPKAQNLYKGVQLYRDGMQRLCQARLDGVMSDNDFSEKMSNLLKQSVKLITGEVSKQSKS
jgi:hypothetical protein